MVVVPGKAWLALAKLAIEKLVWFLAVCWVLVFVVCG